MFRNIFQRQIHRIFFQLQIRVYPCSRHGILGCISENILQNSPHSSPVYMNNRRFCRQIDDHFQIPCLKLLSHLTFRLLDHLHKIYIHILQRNIPTAYLGCLNNVFRQCLQPLCFRLQYIQIALDLWICNIRLLQDRYIINDRSQRCLDIMWYIRDQIRLKTLIFHCLFYGHMESVGNSIDHLCQL